MKSLRTSLFEKIHFENGKDIGMDVLKNLLNDFVEKKHWAAYRAAGSSLQKLPTTTPKQKLSCILSEQEILKKNRKVVVISEVLTKKSLNIFSDVGYKCTHKFTQPDERLKVCHCQINSQWQLHQFYLLSVHVIYSRLAVLREIGRYQTYSLCFIQFVRIQA